MRKKLPILLLALIILLQVFVPAVYAASENEVATSSASFCPFDTTPEGAGQVIDDLPTGGKITGYTKHGTEQALGRDGGIGVSNKAITDAVNNPVKPPISQAGGTTRYIGKDATVVLNQDGKVVTTWANSSAGTR